MKVAFVIDKKGWVQHDRALILKSILKVYIGIFEKEPPRAGFDAIYFSNIGLMKNIKYPLPVYASITSHKTASETNLAALIKRCKKVSVNSLILYEKMKGFGNIVYIPNGVNTDFFSFKEKTLPERMILGWSGNKDRQTKNYYTIFRPLRKRCRSFDFLAVKTSKTTGKVLNRQKMRDFYHKITFFLVTSSTEGTPNPALEAAACGTPLISTPVGNMPEIIVNGRNGFITKPSLISFATLLNNLTLDENTYSRMQKSIRSDILAWDWKNRIPLWEQFFL